ncbi:hypothetical protein BH10ACT11_BH10ACT11_20830 [soil metagenome]
MVDIYAISREMLRIPIGAFFAVAEFAGAWVLKAWLVIWPLLKAAWRVGARVLGFLERELTPARGVALVAIAAAVALGASQFSDYRGVDIGSDAYAGVSNIAPAPQVELASAGSAHAWLGLPLALIAIGLVVLAFRRRAGLARLLAPLGLVVVAISLLVDLPKGLDEGDASMIYDQVHARLLSGFWTQLSAGVVLVVVGPILAAYLQGGRRTRETAGKPGGASMLSKLGSLRPGKPKVAETTT